jgi:D-xylose 1-dehydrogenase
MSASGATYPDLLDMPVLVTGGGSGIGAAIAAAFAAQGARVALLDISAEAAGRTVATLSGMRHAPVSRIVDLRDIAATRAAITDLVKACGPFRALVNNAGDDSRHAWDEVTPELWDERFQVNLRHQFFVAQAIAPMMRAAGGGAIINLGSISWMFGAAGLIAYTTAKSAVEGLTKSLARELGPDRIRVMSVAPGMIWTEKQIARAKDTDPEKLARYLDRQCLKEALGPEDVARLVLWLASAEARRCSGQTFILDGGVV